MTGFPQECRAVLEEILVERQRQLRKWGEQNHPPAHWFLVLAEEFGEAAKDLTKSEVGPWPEDSDRIRRLKAARAELLQTAAVAVAAIESLDRNELAPVSAP